MSEDYVPQTSHEPDTRVHIVMPVYDQVQAETARCLAALCVRSALLIDKITVTTGSTVAQLRNHLGKKAIERGCSHILWVDADMTFPDWGLEHLLTLERPIVAANAARKTWPTDSAGSGMDGSRLVPKREGLEEASAMGLAFMLMKTAVLEKLHYPWFSQMETERGHIGEDVFFCQRARNNGFKIWIDHSLSREIGHVGRWVYKLEPED